MNLKAPSQLTLDFEPGLVERHGSLLGCIAAGVYQHGLGRVALVLDKGPGNLSTELTHDGVRHFSAESLERYIEKTGDKTPIYYLVEKFLSDRGARKDAAQAELMTKLAEIQKLMKRAGVA
jgi:hypothetical protein